MEVREPSQPHVKVPIDRLTALRGQEFFSANDLYTAFRECAEQGKYISGAPMNILIGRVKPDLTVDNLQELKNLAEKGAAMSERQGNLENQREYQRVITWLTDEIAMAKRRSEGMPEKRPE